MNVQVADARVVTATDPYTELWVTVKPRENATRRGGTLYGSYTSQNTGRLQIQSLGATRRLPRRERRRHPHRRHRRARWTTTSSAATRSSPTELGTLKSGGLQRETTQKQKRGELAVATYNVENLDPSDATFDAHAAAIVNNLQSPDIVSLEEIQDDNGATDDGTVAADATVNKLIDAIVAAGGPTYDWRSIDPVNDQDGGEPGGNIRQVFLFNPERVSFTDRAGGDSTTAVGVTKVHGKAQLTRLPGRGSRRATTAWTTSRKPLAGEFVFRGRTVFVIANHFNSKGGDQGLTVAVPAGGAQLGDPASRAGDAGQRVRQEHPGRPEERGRRRPRRHERLRVLRHRARSSRATASCGRRSSRCRKSERYTYDYQGNQQVLDQILVSPSIRRSCDFAYDSVHINSEFHDQISDHDPQVLRFEP